ncbi:MAG: N-acetylmuramoyl-L-alanine amidase [Clostridia bacterium]|nr:N-acetylmuramoyl-L-alanine amidase [Clostridia bacterium]
MNKIDQKAIELYDIYTAAVGGKAWNGDPLPCGKDFLADPTKQTQANGWRAVAAHILTPSNSPIVNSQSSIVNPKTYRIAIDIGHASGTGTRVNGADEHDESVHNAAILKTILESYTADRFEVDIIDFPAENNTGDLNKTIHTINAGHYDLAISLHCDSSTNPSARGAHVCHHRTYHADGSYTDSPGGKALAKEIAARLCPIMPGRANKIQARPDRDLNLSSLAILRQTTPTAVLVETGFLSNPEDLERIRALRYELMRAVALGIAAFCQSSIARHAEASAEAGQ